jgi:hypothetical protein
MHAAARTDAWWCPECWERHELAPAGNVVYVTANEIAKHLIVMSEVYC